MNRNAAAKLDKVEGQLRELKTTTTLLGTTHSPSAAAFYAHLASGASPQILLTDSEEPVGHPRREARSR